MIIVLRLQGLDVKAGTEDIRAFFKRFHIPDGGVYIVGGSLREAFIAFTVERDAQLAMRYTGRFLKGSKVTLHISSMAELEKKLKLLLRKKKKKPSPTLLTVRKPQPPPDANVLPLNASPLDPQSTTIDNLPQPLNPNTSNPQPSNAHSLDFNTLLQCLHSFCHSENNAAVPRVDEARILKQTLDSGPGYVRLFGLPASANKQDICQFFKGLTVQEVIVDVELGRSHACLVKFANTQDAHDALLFNQQSLGPICVEVRAATKKMWTSALQECETAVGVGDGVKTKQSPLRETANHKQKNTYALQLKRQSNMPYKLPKRPRPGCDSITTSSPTIEYTVMVNNLPKGMTKTEIKELFGCPNIAHKNVLHLLDKEGNRTDTVFLTFTCTEDYVYAMNLTGCHVGSGAIEVSSITIRTMRDMIAKTHPRSREHCPKMDTRKKPNRKTKSDPVESPEEAALMNPDPAAQTCLFVRNLPADIQESHIQILFSKYKVGKDNIILLRDINGVCIGEAVVQFKSQKLATLAQRLHGQDFLETKVLLTCINVKQMEDILAGNV